MSAFRISADAARRARLAGSFDAVADDYQRYRPGYPADAVRLALPDHGSSGASGVEVLDLAAGTGKLTDAVLGDQHTHSTVLTASDRQRATFDQEVRSALARYRAGGPAGQRLDLPMQCHVWRSVRRSS